MRDVHLSNYHHDRTKRNTFKSNWYWIMKIMRWKSWQWIEGSPVVWWYYANLETMDAGLSQRFCFVQISGQKPHMVGWCLHLLFTVAAFPSLFLEGFPHIGGDTNWNIKCPREMCAPSFLHGSSAKVWKVVPFELWPGKLKVSARRCPVRKCGGLGTFTPSGMKKRKTLMLCASLASWEKRCSWLSCLHIFQAFHFW